MRVNGIKNQSFGMNPSDVIRKGLAGEIAKGRNMDEFMGLIKEIYPYRFMTAITEGDKFLWVGATKRFDAMPTTRKFVTIGKKECEIPIVHRKNYMTDAMYKHDKEFYDKRYAEHPVRYEIDDENTGFVKFETFFKDVKGKLFDEIIEPIQAKLKAIKEGYNPKERAYLKIANIFPEYKDIPDMERVSGCARDAALDANWMHQPMTI